MILPPDITFSDLFPTNNMKKIKKMDKDNPVCMDCRKKEVVKAGGICTKCQKKRVIEAWGKKIVL